MASSSAATPSASRRPRSVRLAGRRDRLAPRHRRPGHRPRRHLHARRHARRDRHRGARRRQARALREAARQHGRGRGARWPRRPSVPPRAASARWSASATAACPRSASHAPSSPQGRLGEIRQIRAHYLQDWLRRRGRPDDLAPRQGARRLRLARRHRRARDRRRRSTSPADGSTRSAARSRPSSRAPAARRDASGSAGTRVERARAGDRRRRGLFTGRFERRRASARSRRPASRPGARTPSGSSSTARAARSPSTSSDERAPVLRRHRAGRRARLPPHHRRPSPSIPTADWWPTGHGLGYEHGFSTRSSTSSPISRPAGSPSPHSPTACRCSGCSTPSSAAPPTAAHGPATRQTHGGPTMGA